MGVFDNIGNVVGIPGIPGVPGGGSGPAGVPNEISKNITEVMDRIRDIAAKVDLTKFSVQSQLENLKMLGQSVSGGFETLGGDLVQIPEQIKAELGNQVGSLKDELEAQVRDINMYIQSLAGDVGGEVTRQSEIAREMTFETLNEIKKLERSVEESVKDVAAEAQKGVELVGDKLQEGLTEIGAGINEMLNVFKVFAEIMKKVYNIFIGLMKLVTRLLKHGFKAAQVLWWLSPVIVSVFFVVKYTSMLETFGFLSESQTKKLKYISAGLLVIVNGYIYVKRPTGIGFDSDFNPMYGTIALELRKIVDEIQIP